MRGRISTAAMVCAREIKRIPAGLLVQSVQGRRVLADCLRGGGFVPGVEFRGAREGVEGDARYGPPYNPDLPSAGPDTAIQYRNCRSARIES